MGEELEMYFRKECGKDWLSGGLRLLSCEGISFKIELKVRAERRGGGMGGGL